ncbi:tRNA lysidine(34) synthetase TilS [Mariniphaga sediminis]|uniref:tRNA lysidine(34) synthetase TilS n=1 Tax=Mariniphaga sediminis TaxID=1628158 RepID=UPI00356573CA
MLSRFIEYIKEKQLFEPSQRVLLAVSGGIDSMVLLHLFEKSEFNYGVVHCNFRLRGADSDEDEAFVREQVLNHGVPFFFRPFDTEEYARLNGISVEMAARELRYNYFEEIRSEKGYDYIATAHHQDDLMETFFLNLSRKTGIKGLTGIKEKAGHVIRPLLFIGRKEIEDYARFNFIEYREDYTNNEVIYQRNFIRHRILPLFSELNPSFKNSLPETIQHLREAEDVYSLCIKEAREKVVTTRENEMAVSIDALLRSPFSKTLLFEILSEYNFNPQVIDQILQGLKSVSGKQYYSKTHRLVKDREHLFLTRLKAEDERIFYLEKEDLELFAPFDLTIEKTDIDNFQIVKSSHVACIDLDKLEFPLLIRRWKQGDYFQPLGMTGFKKLSDFLIDEKIPVHEKENIWLLCSGQKIVWIMGHRLDNRFKISTKTRRILKIEIKKN